jgi:hypothetical protein
MTDPQLEILLNRAPAPERTPDYWKEFPGQVVARLHETSKQRERRSPERRWAPRLAWGGAIAFACLVLGFVFGHWHAATPKSASNALLQNETMVREILTMFPNRVRAIVQTAQGVQLVLSEKPDVPVSTPIWIKVGGQVAVTFSGQEIQIGGEQMTVLSDSQGGIILMAKQLIWSSTAPGQGANRLKIQAKSLGSVTM